MTDKHFKPIAKASLGQYKGGNIDESEGIETTTSKSTTEAKLFGVVTDADSAEYGDWIYTC